MNEFNTLLEACNHIAVNGLQHYHVEYVLSTDVWMVLPDYETTEAEDSQNDELLHLYLSELSLLGLVSDPHYRAESTHSPLTPDVNCPECQRLEWVAAPIAVQFMPVEGVA